MDWETFKKPLVLAHRGFTKEAVENTLASVEAALKLGVDGIEVDLQMTADGELVIFHDKTLKRLAGVEGAPEEMTVSSLRKILLKDSRIPTLEELLDLVHDRALLNLEIKTIRYFSRKFERKLLSTLSSFRLGPSILVSSFHPLPLLRLKKLRPEIRRGYLFCNRYRKTRYRKNFEKKISPFSLNSDLPDVTTQMVTESHKRGERIFVWTVNDEGDMKRMIDWGVDGIFSDHPDVLIQVLKSHGS